MAGSMAALMVAKLVANLAVYLVEAKAEQSAVDLVECLGMTWVDWLGT